YPFLPQWAPMVLGSIAEAAVTLLVGWYAWRLFETSLAVKLSREEGGAQSRARTVQPLLRAVGRLVIGANRADERAVFARAQHRAAFGQRRHCRDCGRVRRADAGARFIQRRQLSDRRRIPWRLHRERQCKGCGRADHVPHTGAASSERTAAFRALRLARQ